MLSEGKGHTFESCRARHFSHEVALRIERRLSRFMFLRIATRHDIAVAPTVI